MLTEVTRIKSSSKGEKVKKSFLKKVVSITLCLTSMLALFVLPGCTKEKPIIPQTLNELSLTDMWSEVAEAADIQEPTAELETLYLRADENGSLESLYFQFRGRNMAGIPCIYFAEMGRGGRIDIRELESNSVSLSAHPMAAFTEVDKIGLASLEPWAAGLSMRISYQGGDVGYRHAYTNIYHLKDGELLPLKQVIFHTNVYWCTISIFQDAKYETNDAGRTLKVRVNPEATSDYIVIPLEERTSQKWFLSEDLDRAETVEYLED